MAKPIVKWIGGKTQLLEELKKEFPKKFNNYYELFVGGGALAFDLMYKNTIINDLNEEIINMYNAIKKDYMKVVFYIEEYRKKYDFNPKEFYYSLRKYEDICFEKNEFSNAARTIFLNKTCFNGIFRLNSKGEFNVPWNQLEKAPKIYEISNLKSIATFLNSIKITNLSFECFKDKIKSGDFVYLDPPYDKLTKNTFDSYQKEEFGRNGQIALKNFCDFLNEKGVNFLVSNHDTDFIQDLYKDYEIKIVKASRMINSNGQKRGKINEVFIKNFD